jgi:tRNA G18 (ribose-2'-O)-methylase SpoU
VVGVDNTGGSLPIESTLLPRRSLFLFGQEGPGLSEAAHEAADLTVSIAQFGSTRSINAGVAAGIAMHAWICQHAAL